MEGIRVVVGDGDTFGFSPRTGTRKVQPLAVPGTGTPLLARVQAPERSSEVPIPGLPWTLAGGPAQHLTRTFAGHPHSYE